MYIIYIYILYIYSIYIYIYIYICMYVKNIYRHIESGLSRIKQLACNRYIARIQTSTQNINFSYIEVFKLHFLQIIISVNAVRW